ncbi:hypothetical protein ACFL12_00130 [Pseudomonadota bacterium]
MPIDQQERSQFEAALARSSTEAIIKKLDDDVISRSWKRELAEAEVARRQGEEKSRSLRALFKTSQRHNAAMAKGWIATGFLVVCAIVAAVAYILSRMSA